jgi:multiple sugar transport system permease protein/N-acetylglucosamine transport system permease protein
MFVAFPFKVLVSFFIYKKIPFARFYRIVFFFPMIIFSVAVALVFTQIVGTEGFIAQAVRDWMELDYTPELLADSRFANTTVILQMVWLQFPGDLIIWGGTFARIPEDVLESGRIDGVTWWTEFTKIVVPMVWPTVALQMVLLFCGIFGASGNVFLLTRGQYGTMTLNCWMYQELFYNSGTQFTSNVYNYLSAVGLLMTTIAIIISLSIRKLTDKLFDEVEY